MNRRGFFSGVLAALTAFGNDSKESLRGVLTTDPSGKPAIRMSSGQFVVLEGDEPTMGVLRDARLAKADFEAIGAAVAPGRFRIGPIHTRSMFVHKDAKKLTVTYWCDVCYIRTYTPGICWCCQDDTRLDLIEGEK